MFSDVSNSFFFLPTKDKNARDFVDNFPTYFLKRINFLHPMGVCGWTFHPTKRISGIQQDSNPSAQFLLDIGGTHNIVVMRGEHKLSKELRELKRTSIPVLNIFLTLERHII